MTSTLTPRRRSSARPRRTSSLPPRAAPPLTSTRPRRQVGWLAAGFTLAFAIPFTFADTLELNRDLYYALYAVSVLAFVTAWARDSRFTRVDLTRKWRLGVALGGGAAAVLVLTVLKTEEPTDRPAALSFVGALVWRGVVYGATDGVLLSVFPILAVFAAFAGTRLRERRAGRAAIAALALVASLGLTAVYHLGYSDFRSQKVRKPLTGDLVWSAPTLLTLSPLGAPLAHVALHVAAVVHSYETDTYLPPHAVDE
jgi:hypothetical protein